MVLLTSTINMMFLRRRQHSSHKKIQDEANDVQIGIDIGEGRGENIYIYIRITNWNARRQTTARKGIRILQARKERGGG